jgi:hypothetical protein
MADEDLAAAKCPEKGDGRHDPGEVLALLGLLHARRLDVVRPGQREGNAGSGRFPQGVEHLCVTGRPRLAFHHACQSHPDPLVQVDRWAAGVKIAEGHSAEARSAY